ncbi:ring finger domain protein [Niveomyces insectorum RCEF 264]|uniref:Ring finger domain protein n=1 Tax=Niveomyces insectorum RCEF 264 TaxID=1081102 RepID=A0A167N1A3_9HYPO|nr:ring finger domain protein [Niveomyces insectorum RCEF 264]
MPIVDQMLAGAAVLARQVASAATSQTPIPSPTVASLTSPTTSITPVSGTPSSTTSTSATPSPTGGGGGGGGSSGGSSPLLFFVALGFGVVFTNLWIIVGVKYCFRYNARARQLRLAAEDGEPINLENMPRPHRRRREKKLMTIDEVNEKFPMLKYKSWVASRAKEGLPTRGGVDAPANASRANSIRSVELVSTEPDARQEERKSSDDAEEKKNRGAVTTTAVAASASSATTANAVPAAAAADASDAPTSPDSTDPPRREEPSTAVRASYVSADGADDGTAAKDALVRASDEHDQHSDDDDDEHIDAALPPECVGTSGDTCAICIDTLEDDDDVRGLTCGHAFHAVCLDPWLTSRRACCPLCKADYYTPRPRPAAPEGGADATGAAPGVVAVSVSANGELRQHRINMPVRPNNTWMSFRGPGRILPGRFALGSSIPANDSPAQGAPVGAAGASPSGPDAAVENGGPTRPRLFDRMRRGPSASNGRVRSRSPSRSQDEPRAGGSGAGWANRLPFQRRRGESNQPPDQPAPVAGSAAAAPAVGAASEITPSQLEAGVRS